MPRPIGSTNRHTAKSADTPELRQRITTYIREYMLQYGRPPALHRVRKDLGLFDTNMARIVNAMIDDGQNPYIPAQGEFSTPPDDCELCYNSL